MLRRPFFSQVATTAAIAAGCGDGTGPGDGLIHYQFALEAFGRDSTAERRREYDCFVYGFFDVPRPRAAEGAVSFRVQVERRLVEFQGKHIEQTRADTSIADAELVYTGLGENSLQFVFTASTYSVSLGPGAIDPSYPEYAGEWTCGADVPLGQDSTLLAYGYDGDLLEPGRWRVTEMIPFE